MRNLCQTFRNDSGQALLAVVLLGVFLVIGLAVTFFVSQSGMRNSGGSAQRNKSKAIAEAGIAEAITQLSATVDIWKDARNGTFGTTTDCNTNNFVTVASGGQFKLYCSNSVAQNAGLQPYQVAVTAVAYGSGTEKDTPLRAIKAYISQRTLGTDLSTNLHAAAALQLVSQPNITGQLNVDWGPIVCLDANGGNSWDLPEPIDSGRYPRKFSQGGLTGAIYRSGPTVDAGPRTDQKEYVANASQAFPPTIDEAYYIQQAQTVTNSVTPPTVLGVSYPPTGCTSSPPNTCGYFDTFGGTALFDSGYTVPDGSVIFVKGDAKFNQLAVYNATFIITGKLTITGASGGIPTMPLHVPVTAASEYPYGTPTSWPCYDKAGDMTSGGVPAYDCDSQNVFPVTNQAVQFRGFLYVKGEMAVQAQNWNMVGALYVGDTLASPSPSLTILGLNSLNLAYDDLINHNIHVNPLFGAAIKLAPDVIQDVPAF